MEPKRGPARVRILDAAHELMLTVGLARATTKEIAKAAGCSEAALYKYFSGKEEVFIRVLAERLPKLAPLLHALAAEPGRHTLEENLTEIPRQAALFYEQSFPIAASLYAETQLKRRHDDAMREMESGPHKPIEWLDAYLKAEQSIGRGDPAAHPFRPAPPPPRPLPPGPPAPGPLGPRGVPLPPPPGRRTAAGGRVRRPAGPHPA